jgi:hypothetical protein
MMSNEFYVGGVARRSLFYIYFGLIIIIIVLELIQMVKDLNINPLIIKRGLKLVLV